MTNGAVLIQAHSQSLFAGKLICLSWLSYSYCRLYHNVTLLLLDITSRPDSAPYQIELFESFVVSIEKHLNPLKLVEIAKRVSRQLQGR